MPVLDLQVALDSLAAAFDFSSDDMARAVGASAASINRWRTGSHLPQGESRSDWTPSGI
jgi:hypothetical protein